MLMAVLISDPDLDWAKELESFFAESDVTGIIATSGKHCQEAATESKYNALILDLSTIDYSGLEVLKYIRLNVPSMKIVLTLTDSKLLESLALSDEELKKLGVSDILVKPYSKEVLVKSLNGEVQYTALEEIQGNAQDDSEGEFVASDDSTFTTLEVEDFYSGNNVIFDCYMKVGNNRYLKVLSKGDPFNKKSIKKYKIEKDVFYLYFKTKDRVIYVGFINSLLASMIAKGVVHIEKQVRTAKVLTEKYIEEIYTTGIKPQLIEEGKQICKNIYNIIQKDRELALLLSTYEDYDPEAYSHLFLVTFFSTIICKNLEWSSDRTVELIAFGSLLHDVGLLKLPENIRDKKENELSGNDLKIYQRHPIIGAEILQRYPSIPEPVRQIVNQHHEFVNGTGFPNGLTGTRIYPLAKVVSLANEFTNYLNENRITPLEGLKEFIQDEINMEKFDPVVARALMKSFIREK